ncbi:MAG: hypothetical protein ACTSXO_02750 [Candidatus Heimdallarchaeota archaeon]
MKEWQFFPENGGKEHAPVTTYNIQNESLRVWGLPVDIVVAIKK